MKKYCHNCGAENASKDKFCIKCGTELLDMKDEGVKKVEPTVQGMGEYKPPAVQPQPIREKQPPKVSGPSNKTVLGVAAVAIVLSIAAIIIPIFSKGDVTLGAGSVGQNELANNSVTGGKVADGTLTDADITNTGISKIADEAIKSNQIANNSIALLDLSPDVADAITGMVDIANDSITSEKIANGTINTTDLADNSITSAKIKDGEVKSGDINTDAVNYDEIATDAVRSDEIKDGEVDTNDLKNDAVTYDKMAIKIKYGTETGATNGTTVSHGLGSIPSAVILTPLYTTGILDGNYVLHANIMGLTDSQFTIGLWYETFESPPVISEVNGTTFTSGVSVYWIAID